MLSFKWKRILLVTIFFMLIACVGILLNEVRRRQANSYNAVDGFLFQRHKNRRKTSREGNSGPGLEINRVESVFLTEKQSLAELEENFFKYLEKKDVHCQNDVRLGNQHDGGWNVCLSPPFELNVSPCLVYSFGIGNDWRFEDEISDRYKCSVLAFDPSMQERDHNRTSLIRFQRLGLGSRDELRKDGWDLRRLGTHLLEHNHHRTLIDYLKFDIEFMEWEVLNSMLKDSDVLNVKQMGFEIHTQDPQKTQAKDLQSTQEEFLRMYKILKLLEDFEFRKFNYRKNPFCNYVSNVTKLVRSRCYELHYVNLRFVHPYHVKPIDNRANFMGV